MVEAPGLCANPLLSENGYEEKERILLDLTFPSEGLGKRRLYIKDHLTGVLSYPVVPESRHIPGPMWRQVVTISAFIIPMVERFSLETQTCALVGG